MDYFFTVFENIMGWGPDDFNCGMHELPTDDELSDDDSAISCDTRHVEGGGVRPTHFVSLRIDNTEILENIEQIQQDMIKTSAKNKTAMIPMSRMHITILLTRLKDEHVRSFRAALRRAAENLRDVLIEGQTHIEFEGMGNFNEKVVFITPTDKSYEVLGIIRNKIKEQISEKYSYMNEKSWVVPEQIIPESFTPHLTVAKLSQMKGKDRRKNRKLRLNMPDDTEKKCGTQSVITLDFCSMKVEDDGYYVVEETCLVVNPMTISEKDKTISKWPIKHLRMKNGKLGVEMEATKTGLVIMDLKGTPYQPDLEVGDIIVGIDHKSLMNQEKRTDIEKIFGGRLRDNVEISVAKANELEVEPFPEEPEAPIGKSAKIISERKSNKKIVSYPVWKVKDKEVDSETQKEIDASDFATPTSNTRRELKRKQSLPVQGKYKKKEEPPVQKNTGSQRKSQAQWVKKEDNSIQSMNSQKKKGTDNESYFIGTVKGSNRSSLKDDEFYECTNSTQTGNSVKSHYSGLKKKADQAQSTGKNKKKSWDDGNTKESFYDGAKSKNKGKSKGTQWKATKT